jgi:hypothetical protein
MVVTSPLPMFSCRRSAGGDPFGTLLGTRAWLASWAALLCDAVLWVDGAWRGLGACRVWASQVAGSASWHPFLLKV